MHETEKIPTFLMLEPGSNLGGMNFWRNEL